MVEKIKEEIKLKSIAKGSLWGFGFSGFYRDFSRNSQDFKVESGVKKLVHKPLQFLIFQQVQGVICDVITPPHLPISAGLDSSRIMHKNTIP